MSSLLFSPSIYKSICGWESNVISYFPNFNKICCGCCCCCEQIYCRPFFRAKGGGLSAIPHHDLTLYLNMPWTRQQFYRMILRKNVKALFTCLCMKDQSSFFTNISTVLWRRSKILTFNILSCTPPILLLNPLGSLCF